MKNVAHLDSLVPLSRSRGACLDVLSFSTSCFNPSRSAVRVETSICFSLLTCIFISSLRLRSSTSPLSLSDDFRRSSTETAEPSRNSLSVWVRSVCRTCKFPLQAADEESVRLWPTFGRGDEGLESRPTVSLLRSSFSGRLANELEEDKLSPGYPCILSVNEVAPGVDGTSSESKLLLLYRNEDVDIPLYKCRSTTYRRL